MRFSLFSRPHLLCLLCVHSDPVRFFFFSLSCRFFSLISSRRSRHPLRTMIRGAFQSTCTHFPPLGVGAIAQCAGAARRTHTTIVSERDDASTLSARSALSLSLVLSRSLSRSPLPRTLARSFDLVAHARCLTLLRSQVACALHLDNRWLPRRAGHPPLSLACHVISPPARSPPRRNRAERRQLRARTSGF